MGRIQSAISIKRDKGFAGLLVATLQFIQNRTLIISHAHLYEHKLNNPDDMPKVNCGVEFRSLELNHKYAHMNLREYNVKSELGHEIQLYDRHENGNWIMVIEGYADGEFLFRQGMSTRKSGLAHGYLKYYRDEESKETTWCGGWFETNEKYRGKGVYRYGSTKIYEYLKNLGATRVIILAEEGTPGDKVQRSFNSRCLGDVQRVRLLSSFDLVKYKEFR